MTSGFDRLRPRPPGGRPLVTDTPFDPAGRHALFTASARPPVPGTLTVDCSECGEESVLTPFGALRAAIPSVHLPILRRDHPSWMRCPACGRRTWVRLRLHI
jgi:hypothetical protein